MSNALIRAVFEGTLKTWAAAQVPALEVAWENVPLDQPATTYLRAFHLPADTSSLDLAGRHRGHSGLFQVSIALPVGGGSGGAAVIEAALDALFPLTTPLTSGPLKVYVTSPLSAGPAQTEPDRYVVPCTLGYQAHAIT